MFTHAVIAHLESALLVAVGGGKDINPIELPAGSVDGLAARDQGVGMIGPRPAQGGK